MKWSIVLIVRLPRQQHDVDVRENATLRDGDAVEKPVQFLVITNGELDVTGNDPRLLVVPGGVTSKFQKFRGQIPGNKLHKYKRLKIREEQSRKTRANVDRSFTIKRCFTYSTTAAM